MPSKKINAESISVSKTGAAPARKRVTARATRVKSQETGGLAELAGAVAMEAVPLPALQAVLSALPSQGPTQDEIANLAYSYWEARGCLGGSPEDDWVRAERELRMGAPASLAN